MLMVLQQLKKKNRTMLLVTPTLHIAESKIVKLFLTSLLFPPSGPSYCNMVLI